MQVHRTLVIHLWMLLLNLELIAINIPLVQTPSHQGIVGSNPGHGLLSQLWMLSISDGKHHEVTCMSASSPQRF